MEQTPMPVRNCIGEFRIGPAGDAGSTVVRSAEFELTGDGDQETVESVRQFLHAGIGSLRRRQGGGPPRD